MSDLPRQPSVAADGWTLALAEERFEAAPDSFPIPPRDERDSLSVGDAAKLLFDIETRENGRVIDRGVDRMWVIVKTRTAVGYVGVLDSDPGQAENLKLRKGDLIAFGPQHVVEIDRPPRTYIVENYGISFFEE